MMPLEAIELPLVEPQWSTRLDLLLRMLHALTISENPYGYLIATQPRRPRPRA